MAQLGIQLLQLTDLNHYAPVPYAQLTEGQDYDLYFQLVDLDQPGACNKPVPYTPNAKSLIGAIGSVQLAGLTGGSVVSVSIAGISFSQAFTVDIPTTVTALVMQINASPQASQLVVASPSGATLQFTSMAGLGALGNSFALSALVAAGSGSVVVSGAFLSGGVGAGSAMAKIEFLNIDDAKIITRFASQPFAGLDSTIWYVPFLATDPISAGTANMRVTLFEGTKTSFAYLQGAFRINSSKQNSTQPGGPSGPTNFSVVGS